MQLGPDAQAILTFIRDYCGKEPDALGRADLFATLRLDGDEAEAFMQAFALKFNVDLTGYEPAYHHRTKGRAGRFGWPIPVPYQFGVRIPVALSHLVQASKSGKWTQRYPVLNPKVAHDWVNWIVVLGGLPLLVAGMILLIQFL